MKYSIDNISPNNIEFPKTTDDLSNIVYDSYNNNQSISPWGSGSLINLGNTIKRLNTIIDLSKMEHFINHNPGDLTLTTSSNININSINELLKNHGQQINLDPPLPEKTTIGGAIATGLNGPTKWQFGHIRDYVIGMSVVQSNGKIVKTGGKVVKNVSGYDMSKLHIGALGTLGIINQISFKLIPLPKKEVTLVANFNDFTQSISASLEIFNSNILPLALSNMNNYLNLNNLIIVKIGGRNKSIKRQINDCINIFKSYSSLNNEEYDLNESDKIWSAIRDFGWNNNKPNLLVKFSLSPTKTLEFSRELQKIKYDVFKITILSHPGFGNISLNFIPVDKSSINPNAYLKVISDLYNFKAEIPKTITIENCPTEIKSNFDIWGEHNESIKIMENLKNQYDPKNILNPGRFIGGI